jgi:hypothetical protein
MSREQVKASKLGTLYFDLAINPDDVHNHFCSSFLPVIILVLLLTQEISGDLNAHPPIYNSPFTAILKYYNALEEPDVLAMAKIMQRCL